MKKKSGWIEHRKIRGKTVIFSKLAHPNQISEKIIGERMIADAPKIR